MKKPPRTSSERLLFYILLMLLDGNISFQKVSHSGGQFVLYVEQDVRLKSNGDANHATLAPPRPRQQAEGHDLPLI